MKPGATTRPVASMVSRASPGAFPTATMRPSLMATSPGRAAAPVPSMIVPPMILIS